jgi:transcription-repair coupling factor (superfamily II helicase)
MIDRFGLLPAPVKQLFLVTELKLLAAPLGIRKIEVGAQGGRLVFGSEPHVDPVQIVRLIQTRPQQYKLEGNEKLRFQGDFADNETRARAVRDLLETLAAPKAA